MLIQSLKQNEIVVEVPELTASNKTNVIRVLHVDDDPPQIEISGQILRDIGKFEIGIHKASTS